MYYTESLDKLVKELGKLPGIGPRSAQKMAFHLMKISKEEARELAQAIVDIKEKTRYCSICNNLSEGGILSNLHKSWQRQEHNMCC